MKAFIRSNIPAVKNIAARGLRSIRVDDGNSSEYVAKMVHGLYPSMSHEELEQILDSGRNPVTDAAKRKDVTFLKESKSNLSISDANGTTALKELTNQYKKRIANLAMSSDPKFNLLHAAAGAPTIDEDRLFVGSVTEKEKATLVSILVENPGGIHIDSPDQYGNTPLREAVSGTATTVQYLVSKGANINATGDSATTPLWAAAVRGNVSVVKTLLDAGADVGKRHRYTGETAADVVNRRLDDLNNLKVYSVPVKESLSTIKELLSKNNPSPSDARSEACGR